MGSTAAAALLLLFTVVPAVLAVTFQVGDDSGWNFGVDYTVWASGKTFRVGDTLEFKYGASHGVAVVDKAGYDSCDTTGATQSFSDGDTKIDLTKVGTVHFICPTFSHCPGGMKLAVPVLAAASSPSTPSSPPSPPSSPKSPPSSPKSPPPSPETDSLPPLTPPPANDTPDSEPLPRSSPPPPPSAASKGVISYGMVGITLVLMHSIMS